LQPAHPSMSLSCQRHSKLSSPVAAHRSAGRAPSAAASAPAGGCRRRAASCTAPAPRAATSSRSAATPTRPALRTASRNSHFNLIFFSMKFSRIHVVKLFVRVIPRIHILKSLIGTLMRSAEVYLMKMVLLVCMACGHGCGACGGDQWSDAQCWIRAAHSTPRRKWSDLFAERRVGDRDEIS